MKALAAGRPQVGVEVEALETLLQEFRGVADLAPGYVRPGIDIDDHAIGVLGIVDLAAPWMKLDSAELREGEEAFRLDDRQEVRAPLFVRQRDPLDAFRQAGKGVALVEAVFQVAGRAADEGHWPPKKLR